MIGGYQKVIAIAASTGGVEALEVVFQSFPAKIPPVLLVLHMPQGFTRLYSVRLNGKMPFSVKEAQTGDLILPNQVLIAAAGKHMKVVNQQGKFAVDCFIGPKVQHVIPSADVLFESVANVFHRNAVGVILTGMGADGAEGLLMMRNSGARTVGQDKSTSAVYGMPKVAMEMGSVEYQLPLDKIADKILSLV